MSNLKFKLSKIVAAKKIFIILFVIIAIGTALRFYKLGELSFVADEFLDINSSYAYSQAGAWQSWDFNHGKVNADNVFAPRDERAWPYKIQVAQMFKLFAPTEAIARSVSVLWGILSIILIYFVAKYFTKKNTIGLLSAFLFAVSISGIIFDRRLRMYAMFFPVFLLFSWLLYKFYEQPYVGKHKWCKKLHEKLSVNVMYIVPAILVGALSMKVHDLTVSIAAVFSVYVIIMAGKSIYSKNSLLNKYTVTLGVVLAVTAAAFIFAFDRIGKYAAGIKFFNDNFSYFSIVTTDYSHPIVALLFFAIGLYYLIKQKKATKEAVWLAVSFVVPLLMAVFLWRRNAGPQYIFFAQSFEMILIASGIYAVADYLENNLKGFSAKKTFMATMILTVVLLPDWAYFAQENNVYNQTSKAENPNYREIFTYFKKKKIAGDVLLTRNFRNYYLSGQNVKVYDFGGELAEEKFPLSSLQSIVRENQSGWVILSDNDERYIANDAMKYIESNMTKINDVAVRGNVMVYRWGNK